MKKIGIIGCGAIGTAIGEFIARRLRGKARVAALCDVDRKKAAALSKKMRPRPGITDIDNLIKKSDFIVEAAGAGVSGKIVEKIVRAGKDCLIMSSGGLLEKGRLLEKASEAGINIHIPSGAICGLDALGAARIGRIKKVTLTTRKPLRGLRGAPGFLKKNISLTKETVLYNGNARDAVKYFPRNINVAATLSLYGIGPERTRVKIITAPGYTRNIHEVEIEGEFGRVFTRAENLPSKSNPKTSQLAIFSALSKLKEVI